MKTKKGDSQLTTITVETDAEEQAIRVAFHDGTLFRAIRHAFTVKRDGRDVCGASAPLLGADGGPRETYISVSRATALSANVGPLPGDRR